MDLRIFISSPGDVSQERAAAEDLLKSELPYDPAFRDRVSIEVVSWSDRYAPVPMALGKSPQTSVNKFRRKPSECNIVILILWSRLGTPLKIDEFNKDNGDAYQSGTEWEYEDALRGLAANDTYLYRKTEQYQIDADDPDALSKIDQRRNVLKFIERITKNGRAWSGGVHEFSTTSEFRDALSRHLREVIHHKLAGESHGLSENRTALSAVNPATIPELGVFRDVAEAWCPEMVKLPTGQFLMGSPEGEPSSYGDERPQHVVSIVRPVAIGRYLITFEEYDHYCEMTNQTKPLDENWGRGWRPVLNVSWHDAQNYVAWLSDITGNAYRLPSEAEWEYACRAGTTTAYAFGGSITAKYANIDAVVKKTTDVGSYPANRWGLYDMHGNLWEWVADTWHDNYTSAPADGSAWTTNGDDIKRVVRGGSYNYPAAEARSSIRCGQDQYTRDVNHGFRVLREL
jgi:formylglycine-generating enzyme required for sulfatase activity